MLTIIFLLEFLLSFLLNSSSLFFLISFNNSDWQKNMWKSWLHMQYLGLYYTNSLVMNITRGPKGHRSLTWGKGQGSQWSHLQRTTNVVHQRLVENLQMMQYTNYESSGPCSFRQEDFWKLHFEDPFFTPWPSYATNQNHLYNFGRGPPMDHTCWVWSNSH